jgi:hypothetical protein
MYERLKDNNRGLHEILTQNDVKKDDVKPAASKHRLELLFFEQVEKNWKSR